MSDSFKFHYSIIIALMLCAGSAAVAGNPDDSVSLKPIHRNVIKFNPTPMLVLANVNNITFSYERLIKDNQSICLQVGYLLFPRIYTDTLLNLIALHGGEKWGVNLAVDYRFYPMKRNRRPAPDGLYLGGYVSYYGFQFRNPFDIVVASADHNGAFEGKINVVNLGMSLGYQFVFWKRFTIDMLMFGPSLSYYRGTVNIKGALDPEQIENVNEELVQKLMERFPTLKELFSDDEMTFTGKRTSLSIGFRYALQLGFHF